MKSVLLSLMFVAALVSGCSSSEQSPGPLGQGAKPGNHSQPQAEPTPKPSDSPIIAPENRLSSGLFFMAINLTDAQSKQSLVNAVFLEPNPSIYKDGVYRATETIELGEMTPDEVQVVAPVPPEFGPTDSVTATLHYGCGGNGVADFYPFKADLTNVTYEINDGMPRYFLASGHLRPLFSFCANTASKVSVVVEFHDTSGRVLAWEQFYIEHGGASSSSAGG